MRIGRECVPKLIERRPLDDGELLEHDAALGEQRDDGSGARAIAQRSRGTPRIANRLLRRVRDYAQVRADGRIDERVAKEALNMLEVDPEGFDTLDQKLLTTIIDRFGGGPVGIESIAAALGEDRGTLEEVIEPFLIQQGFLARTARGRMVTASTYRHFGRKEPVGQGSMPLALEPPK